MEEASGGKDVVTFRVGTSEAFLSFKVAGVDGDDGGVLFVWVIDKFGVAERSLWVEKVVRTSSELDPLAIRRKRSEMGGKGAEYFLRSN